MIAADREFVAAKLKRDEVELYNELLTFHTNCVQSLGTVAALIASFGFSILANNLPDTSNIVYFVIFQITAVASMFTSLWAVCYCCLIYMSGPGLALRGPEGSMVKAVNLMQREINAAFYYFKMSVALLHITTVFLVWSYVNYLPYPGMADYSAPVVVSVLALVSVGFLLRKEREIRARFNYDDQRARIIGGVLDLESGEVFNPEPGAYQDSSLLNILSGPVQKKLKQRLRTPRASEAHSGGGGGGGGPLDQELQQSDGGGRRVSEMERLIPVLRALEKQNQQLIDSQQRQSAAFMGYLKMHANEKNSSSWQQQQHATKGTLGTGTDDARESYLDSFSDSSVDMHALKSR